MFLNINEDLGKLSSILKKRNGSQDCYFGVALRGSEDGSKNGIYLIPALWLEHDRLTREIEREIEAVAPPSCTIQSSIPTRRHLYWILKEPASKNEISKIEDINKRLAKAFEGDSNATDASRILRIPGTINWKYTPPLPVDIMELKDCEYNLSDFDFLPELKELSSERSSLPIGWQGIILGGVVEGERNMSISRLAGRYLGKGLSKEEILPILFNVNSRFIPPLPESEVENVLDSILKTDRRNRPEENNSEAAEIEAYPEWVNDQMEPSRFNLKIATLDDIFQYTDPTYLIKELLIEGTVNVLGGYTGHWKSITALSIAKSLATGQALWGKFIVKSKGPVLLIDEETPEGLLKQRLKLMGFTDNFPIHFLHFQGIKIDDPKCFKDLSHDIKKINPVLLVIDSLIRIHSKKESDATEMSRVMGALRQLANLGTTILAIHHHRKGEGPPSEKLRGSSDIPGGIDCEFSVTPKGDFWTFQSVKTRIKPLAPILLEMIATDEKIEVVFRGSQEEHLLERVKTLLAERDGLTIPEILSGLNEGNQDNPISDYALRKTIKRAEAQGDLFCDDVKEGRYTKKKYRLEAPF